MGVGCLGGGGLQPGVDLEAEVLKAHHADGLAAQGGQLGAAEDLDGVDRRELDETLLVLDHTVAAAHRRRFLSVSRWSEGREREEDALVSQVSRRSLTLLVTRNTTHGGLHDFPHLVQPGEVVRGLEGQLAHLRLGEEGEFVLGQDERPSSLGSGSGGSSQSVNVLLFKRVGVEESVSERARKFKQTG